MTLLLWHSEVTVRTYGSSTCDVCLLVFLYCSQWVCFFWIFNFLVLKLDSSASIEPIRQLSWSRAPKESATSKVNVWAKEDCIAVICCEKNPDQFLWYIPLCETVKKKGRKKDRFYLFTCLSDLQGTLWNYLQGNNKALSRYPASCGLIVINLLQLKCVSLSVFFHALTSMDIVYMQRETVEEHFQAMSLSMHSSEQFRHTSR